MVSSLTDQEFGNLFGQFEHTAFRLELQAEYREPEEAGSVREFLTTSNPTPLDQQDWYVEWLDLIRDLTRDGKRVERVRVQHEPPTGYQRWERWSGRWNILAGETMRYMPRSRAHEVGLLPKAGNVDWWLLDSKMLVNMYFDEHGNRLRTELTEVPSEVVRACALRDLAVHYAPPDVPGDPTA